MPAPGSSTPASRSGLYLPRSSHLSGRAPLHGDGRGGNGGTETGQGHAGVCCDPEQDGLQYTRPMKARLEVGASCRTDLKAQVETIVMESDLGLQQASALVARGSDASFTSVAQLGKEGRQREEMKTFESLTVVIGMIRQGGTGALLSAIIRQEGTGALLSAVLE